MKSEDAPITDDEFLLRRVRCEKFRSNEVPRISPNAFEPRISGRDPDIDGISLYREACLDDSRPPKTNWRPKQAKTKIS